MQFAGPINYNRTKVSDDYRSLNNRRRVSSERPYELDDDAAHRQYLAVQRGEDIPLMGLRKPAPQQNIHKGK